MAVYQFSVNVPTNANFNVIVQFHDESGNLIDAFNAGTLITWSYGIPNPVGVGDGVFDELIGSSSNDYIFWDWETADFGSNTIGNGSPTDRYFLPGGSQTAAIDIFSLGDGDDIISLTYNRHVPGFQSYDWNATIYGGNGNDLIMSGNGNDMLFGGNGRDTIYGGGGDDVIVLEGVAEGLGEFAFGGSGNDTIYGTSGNDSLYGGDDDDYIEGFDGVDEIYGGAGNDTIYGGAGGNGLTTGDILDGGSGNDTIYGGAGKDFIEGGAGFQDRMFGGDGNDEITDIDGFVVMSGGAGNDNMYSNFAFNWVAPGNTATVLGGGGSDQFSMNSAQANLNLVIQMDDGTADAVDEVVFTNVGNRYATVTATMGGGNDLYIGSYAAAGNGTLIDIVDGGSGNDTLFGGSGNDTLYGGAGFLDVLYGDANTALGNGGNDVLYDSDGVAFARGGEGNDTLNISFASNWIGPGGQASNLVTLEGNGGSDTFNLQSANSAQNLLVLADDGSADGNDVVSWAAATSSYNAVTANMGGGNDVYIGAEDGGAGNRVEVVHGGLGNDTIYGGAGNDTLYGTNQINSTLDGSDLLFGGSGDDTLYGGHGIDSLFGGAGNDVMIFNADNVTAGVNGPLDYVQGWDGANLLVQHSFDGRTVNWSFDRFDGGAGLDTLVGTSGNDIIVANTDDLYINGVPQASNPNRLAGVEVVLLGAGADIFLANDPNGATTTGTVYSTSITVYGGDGNDAITTGSGNDLLIGDSSVAGSDLLAGGTGNDVIWGDFFGDPHNPVGGVDTIWGGAGNDTLYGGGGNDTIFGGVGIDTIFGGAGDDYIQDLDGAALLFGGDGADRFLLSFNSAGFVVQPSSTGADAAGDGDDYVRVIVWNGNLAYDQVSMTLGAGNDTYVTTDGLSGNQIDRIDGESGDDIISTWAGNDVLWGGTGNDALWGGSGSDTIYGGPGSDYLYAGSGVDIMYGGTGHDYYYWARVDGPGDQIWDEFRGTPVEPGQQVSNTLLVYPGFDANGIMPAGTGVVEVDRNLMDNIGGDDMVQIVDLDGPGGSMWRLDIVSGAGTGSSVTFDQRDIDTIALWNHEPGPGQAVIQIYQWDETAQTYLWVSG